MIYADSDTEQTYLALVQNQDVVFKLGWHVRRNHGQDTTSSTTAQRDAAEAAFFGRGAWTTINPKLLGVGCLKPRMSNVLKDQFLLQPPSLVKDVEPGLADCERRLELLEDFRITTEDQRQYLLRVSQRFSMTMKAAVDGNYTDSFFGATNTPQGVQKRLRAVVQNALTAYMKVMQTNGHS